MSTNLSQKIKDQSQIKTIKHSKPIHAIAVSVVLSLCSIHTYSQVSGKAAPPPELIGGYITVADINDKIKSSQCGAYLKKSKMITKKEAIASARTRVRSSDIIELDKFLSSDEFERKMQKNTEFVQTFLKLGVADGADLAFLCGTLVGMHTTNSQKILKDWNN